MDCSSGLKTASRCQGSPPAQQCFTLAQFDTIGKLAHEFLIYFCTSGFAQIIHQHLSAAIFILNLKVEVQRKLVTFVETQKVFQQTHPPSLQY